MTASPSIDAFDAQMLDFSSDPDVPMNITGSAEFFVEAVMDHDGHLAASTYSEHASVEVDMEEYVGDNAEYEMADETADYQRPHGGELLDIEVYDASHAPSPLVPPRPLPPSADVLIDSERQPTTSTHSEHATHLEPETRPTPLDDAAADVSHVEPSVSRESVFSETTALEQPHPSDVPDRSHLPSVSHEQLGDLARADGQLLEVPVPAGASDETEHPVPLVAAPSGAVQHENLEPPMAEVVHLPEDDAAAAGDQDEKAPDRAPVGQETLDPLYISDDVYTDPPPAVLLFLSGNSEPGFALFSSPDVGDESAEDAPGNQKSYSLLLEDRPALYFEPLSSVFEALRQDEGLLSRIPHSFEGELVLDAHDLQLAVSEDNVHSREISLHDLNILHDGSDFVGPLRLHLRASVPRFIIRYYALQEQIQRLQVAAETEGEHDEEHRDHYDTVEEQPLPQQEEVVEPPSLHAATIADGFNVVTATGAKEPIKEPASEPTEETPQNYDPEDATTAQEPAVEYHEVTEEATRALEDENDDGTNVGDEDEPARYDVLDADQVHDVAAEDTDAPDAVIRQESEFGDEQTEHLDYVQLEEYEERYGEELPELAGGASAAQYGERPQYEEGEQGQGQDLSTVVDETETTLPGSGENEEDQSAATPTPARAILEPEANDPITVYTNESLSTKQDIPASSSEEFLTSESKDGVDYVQASGSQGQEPSTVHARVFSEVEESDANFVKMLEREADAEFDRTFSTEQSRQEGGIEASLQHDESWDDWDDEDAEGVDEEDWIDPDAESNESSVTLSSKASSKRNYDEVDPNESPTAQISQNSPDSKRPRVA